MVTLCIGVRGVRQEEGLFPTSVSGDCSSGLQQREHIWWLKFFTPQVDRPGNIMAGFVSPGDIVNLILAIHAAVETVQGNKEECQVIADRVNRIHLALSQRKDKESFETLYRLHQTLKEILAFLQKFGDAGYFHKFLK